jgi:hypothetical protein
MQQDRNSWRPAIQTTVLLCVCALAAITLGYIFHFFGPPNPTGPSQPVADQFIHGANSLHPKPADRFIFAVLTATIFTIVVAGALIAKHKNLFANDCASLFWIAATSCAAIALYLGAWDQIKLLISGPELIYTSACFVFAGSIFYAQQFKLPKSFWFWISLLFGATIIVTFRIWNITSIEYLPYFTSHYEAVIYPVVAITAGGTCLADVIPQYGCYGEILAPLLRLAGASTAVLTTLFAILQIISLAAVLHFTAHTIRSPAVFFAAAIALIISTNLLIPLASPDPYFAYYPIRFVFPALSLSLTRWNIGSPIRYVSLGLFAGIAIVWNLDSGVPVCIALGLSVFASHFTSLDWKRSDVWIAAIKRGTYFSAATAAVLILSWTYLLARSSGFANPLNYIIYQQLFYIAGFAMIPLPAFPDWWTVAVIILSISLWAVAVTTTNKLSEPDDELESVAFLTVLGLGLFVYFTGRSHLLVLRLVIWPEIILFFFLADRCLRTASTKLARIAHAATMVTMLGLSLSYILASRELIAIVFRKDWTRQPTSYEFERDLAFLRSRTSPGETVAIFADNQATLYGETGTRPSIRGPGMAELLRVADRDAELDSLVQSGPEKLFYGEAPAEALGISLDVIRKRYALAEWSDSGHLMYLRRKPFKGQDLFGVPADKPATSWRGQAPQYSYVQSPQIHGEWGRPLPLRSSFNIPGAVIDQSFAVRLLLTPDEKQTAYAALFSSHDPGFKGIAILHSPVSPESYVVVVGNGKTFWFSPPFIVPANRQSELLLSYNRGHLVVRVSGVIVLDQTGLDPLVPSDAPVTIGDWHLLGRQFAGEISEVDFFEEALP